MHALKIKNKNNPIISYLNINHLRNKVVDLRPVVQDLEPTVLAIAETKLNDSFPNAQFRIDGYYCPSEYRKDRIYNGGGGLLVYIKKGTPSKRLKIFEPEGIESIFVEISIGKQKWCIISTYRSEDIKVDDYINKLSKSLDQVFNTYENVILMGDINIDFLNKISPKFKKLLNLCDTFGLENLIKSPTCFQGDPPSSIDLILTNKNRSFINSKVVATGLSDWHGMVTTMLRAHIKKIEPTKITYRSLKNFSEQAFLQEIEECMQNRDFSNEIEPFESFSNDFKNILERYAPKKSKIVRGNDAPFMTKQLRSEIRHRSRLSNKAKTEKTQMARLAFRKQRNKCTKLLRQSKKAYFEKITESGGKRFWEVIKSFVTDKGAHRNEEYILEEGGELIKDPNKISETFISYFTNIVEHATGNPPENIPLSETSDIIDDILGYYESHASVLSIKEKSTNLSFKLPLATEEEIYDIIKSIDIKKATGVDNIPPKVVKIAANAIKKPLTEIINIYINKNTFPDLMKIGRITPIYKHPKNGSRLDKQYYRPVSVLTIFSKVFERFVLNSMLEYINSILSDHISAYRKGYSCQNVLLKLTEEWRQYLDKNEIVGAVLMDLSKAFDCLPHELLLAKLSAYGFERDTLNFFYSYLKGRKQTVNIKGESSMFLDILAGVPQGSILGPILFNIFLNDIIDIFKETSIYNFADDNTLSCHAKNIECLINKLETDSEKAIKWFTENRMIANPDKFKAIIIRKNGQDTTGHKLKINNGEIQSSEEVTLLGVVIDNKLSLVPHISNMCRKAATILNSLKRQNSYLVGIKTRTMVINTYVLSQFNYCPLIWHFCGKGATHKIEQINERALRFVHNDYTSDYRDILEKSNTTTLYLKRVRIIAQEVYKSLNNESPKYTQELVRSRHSNYPTRQQTLDIYVPRVNQVKFGYRSYTYEAPVLWNSLPNEIRKAENFSLFKKLIKSWNGSTCRCNYCKYFTLNQMDTLSANNT